MGTVKTQAQIRRKLRALQRTFLAQLPDRVQAIETALSGALDKGEIDRERVDELFHLAHRLSGSAGIYGYPAVHAGAGAVERVAEGLREASARDEPAQLAELRRLVEALKQAVEDATAGSAAAK